MEIKFPRIAGFIVKLVVSRAGRFACRGKGLK